ncbi:MAG TPA: hypothetical protein VLU25_12955 [Acidobacteriota bacterium]|nr:hypothetical protein [Acidobacteriota bacterium]
MKKRLPVYIVVALALLIAFLYLPREERPTDGPSQERANEQALQQGGSASDGNAATAGVRGSRLGREGQEVGEAGFKTDRARLGEPRYSLEFSGNEVFSDRILRSAVRLPAVAQDRETLGAVVERDLTDFYRNRGYMAIAIRRIEISMGQPIEIVCELSEGDLFTYGEVTVLSPDAELAEALKRAAPKGAPLNNLEFREFVNQITLQKQSAGYLDFEVRTHIFVGQSPTVPDLEIEVIPSERYTVGEITYSQGVPPIEGIEQLSGLPYSRSALERFLQRAGLPWEVVWLRKNRSTAVVDIRIRKLLPGEGQE